MIGGTPLLIFLSFVMLKVGLGPDYTLILRIVNPKFSFLKPVFHFFQIKMLMESLKKTLQYLQK